MAMNSLYIGNLLITTLLHVHVYIINKCTVCEITQKMLFNFSEYSDETLV